jgi:WD40 repeat protein/subtilisin-like proprotein convertase family protein
MIAKTQDRRYFVAGGPVRPDHPSHVRRAVDDTLALRLTDGECCHVVAPRDSGKTSLMAATAERLREAGINVASVNLGQVGERDAGDDIGRWFYSIAFRLARELRISGIQSWWQDHASLTALQRLRAFFLDLVLGRVEGRVVIFVDGAEAVLDEPRLADLFAAIRACHDARATDATYERLTFCLLSAVPPDRLLPASQHSPFDVSTAVSLPPFTLAETRHLAAGLPVEGAVADELAERIWRWTGGQPYLTQRLLRGLLRRAHRGIHVHDLDGLVTALFFGPNATSEDPHLSAISALVLAESPRRAARLTLYGKIRKGIAVPLDRASALQRDLLDAGLLCADELGNLGVANNVYRGAFTAGWANAQLPLEWRGIVAAIAAALFVIAMPVWYTEYLPRPYMRTLEGPPRDFVAASEAHQRLRMLPGYRSSADQLFREYLARQSRAARRLPEVRRIGARLAEIPGGAERVADLEAEFWDRRAREQLLKGDRDAGLLFNLEALAVPTAARRALAADLWRETDERIVGTVRAGRPLVAVEAGTVADELTTLDTGNRARRWRVDASGVYRTGELQLSAEEQVSIQQRAVHAGPARASRLALSVLLNHPRPADVDITLISPAGRSATVSLAGAPAGSRPGAFRLDSARYRALRDLLADRVTGSWSAQFADRRRGERGALQGWTLQLDGRAADAGAAGTRPTPIPEPRTAMAARSALAPGGRYALTYPTDAGVAGDIRVYDVERGQAVGSIARAGDFRRADFAVGGRVVLAQGDRGFEAYSVPSLRLAGRIPLTLPRRPAPILSAAGAVLVTDVSIGDTGTGLAAWDLARMRPLGRVATGGRADVVAVDDLGRVLAVGDGDRLVRVWRVADSVLLAELAHAAAPTRAWLSGSGRWLAVADAADQLTLWDTAAPRMPRWQATGHRWTVTFAADDSALLAGSADGRFEWLGLPAASPLSATLWHGVSFAETGRPTALFAAAPATVVTYDGRRALRIWRRDWPTPVPEGVLPARVALDAAGARLAIGTMRGDVRFGPAGSEPVLAASGEPGFIGHAARVTALVFSGSGKLAASGAADGTIRAWDPATGEPRAWFGRHPDGAVHDLAIAPGDRYIYSAASRALLAIDALTGDVVGQASAAAGNLRLLPGLAADEVYVASAQDGVRRWTWRGGNRESAVSRAPQISRAVLSVDGSSLAIAGQDGEVRLARLPGGRPDAASVQLPSPVDGLWFADRTTVLAQSGTWLHVLSAGTEGLLHTSSQRLASMPAAMLPLPGGRELALAEAAFPGYRVRRIGVGPRESDAAIVDPARLEQKLNLAVDDTGELRTLQP